MNGIKSYVSYNDMHTHKHADVLAHMQKKGKDYRVVQTNVCFTHHHYGQSSIEKNVPLNFELKSQCTALYILVKVCMFREDRQMNAQLNLMKVKNGAVN